MSTIHRWWKEFPHERYWLEVTDRPDIGVNLKAPKTNETGGNFWGYSFIREVVPGDVIFHYDKNHQAITARSVATGKTWSDLITWAAHGTYARAAGIEPHLREGVYLGLEAQSPLEAPVTLDQIRKSASAINHRLDELNKTARGSLYYPFERSEKRQTRPLQGYLFKLPAFFLELFPTLGVPLGLGSLNDGAQESVGIEYRRAVESHAVGERDPFAVDPSIVERGLRGHVETQNQLAEAITAAGLCPRSPTAAEPNFDLAWKDGSTICVAEVKSITNKNEEKQLRLGLGQVLRYAHLLAQIYSTTIRPVLVAERQPKTPDWLELCHEHDVLLLWPPFHLVPDVHT